jgi:hypothetical protein
MVIRPAIWIADAAHALSELAGAPDETLAAALAMLGLERRQRDSQPTRSAADELPPLADDAQLGGERKSPADENADEVSAGAVEHVPRLEPVAREPMVTASWEIPSLPLPQPEHIKYRPPYEALLAPRSASANIAALVSQTVDDGDVDLEALVNAIAENRPVDRLPRHTIRTTRYGVELLIDVGDGMRPFQLDQQHLVERVLRLVGTGSTVVRYFADAPLRGAGTGPSWKWQPYVPRQHGARLIVVSDFGIGGPALHHTRAEIGEWQEFVSRVRSDGCRPVGLVPYPPRRWPAQIRTLLPLITWDRTTTTARIHAAIGER